MRRKFSARLSSAHDAAPGPAPGPVTPEPDLAPLPGDWEARVDPSSGRTFYINLIERITSWERPPMRDAVGRPEADGDDDTVSAAASVGGGVAADASSPASILERGGSSVAAAAAATTATPIAAVVADGADEAVPMGVPISDSAPWEPSSSSAGADQVGDYTGAPSSHESALAPSAPAAGVPDDDVDADTALEEVDTMWERMRLRERPAPQQPAAAAAAAIRPPPPGASREVVKAYRAAIRAAAVDNIGRHHAEVNAALAGARKV